jgi:hypothetical protein
MAHVKDKKIWKTKKITIHMDLWKYGQILTIQKSLIIKQRRFSKKKILHMSLSSCMTLYIESQ